MKVSRAERAAQAARYKAAGLDGAAIARVMGLCRKRVYELLHDPTGEKERARKYRHGGGVCADCGKPTSWSSGHGNAREGARRCQACEHADPSCRYWTPELVIDAIQEYARRYGRPPSATHFNPSQATKLGRLDLAERFHDDGCWPHAGTVQSMFGSWNAGIEAAGFEPWKPNAPRHKAHA